MSIASKKKYTSGLYIVGAQKSGTTTLADVISQHQDFYLVPGKEPNFFGQDLKRHMPKLERDEYERLFASANSSQIKIDASTSYLMSSSAAREIKAYDAEAKIIIILRDPVCMLHSWHAQMLYTGDEDVNDFYEALMKENDRRHGGQLPRGVIFEERLYYTSVGKYLEQVNRYIKEFGRDAVKIILFEDFIKNVSGFAKEISEFCGIYDDYVFKTIHSNPNTVIRSPLLRDLRGLYVKSRYRNYMRNKAPGLMSRLGRVYDKYNTKKSPREAMDPEAINYLRSELLDDADKLDNKYGLGAKGKWKVLYGE